MATDSLSCRNSTKIHTVISVVDKQIPDNIQIVKLIAINAPGYPSIITNSMVCYVLINFQNLLISDYLILNTVIGYSLNIFSKTVSSLQLTNHATT